MPETDAITVITLETPTLGDRSYLVHDGEVAFMVDPQRDIDRVLALLDAHHLRLTHVLESHIHNDYVTGGLALARRAGAAYLVNADDKVSFDRTPVRDGDILAIGPRMRVTVVATPGHTFTHLSYVLADARTGEQRAVFSGGSLRYGATGRPDLLGPQHSDHLARAQHASARKLAQLLPDAAQVFPTHGFGSFCSATQSAGTSSTIGLERAANPVLTRTGRPTSASCWPALAPTLPTTRTWPPRTRRGRPSRTCPRPARPTRPRSGGASRPASGWWTCAAGPCSPPGTCPGR